MAQTGPPFPIATRMALVALGVGLFALHASLYREWLIDDSGISIAYANNLARGHGLVSQPGMPPVEGYSNPLWVFVLAALSRAGVLALPLVPKMVSGIFIGTAYASLLAIIARVAPHPRLVGAFVLIACSTDPAVVIWCTSGLENALYACTVVSLAYSTVLAIESTQPNRAFAVCGAASVLVAMTRPDGVIFALVPPAIAFAAGKRERRPFVAYGATFICLFGAFMIARMMTFHHLVPNTAIAKGGPRMADAVDFFLLTRIGIDKMDSLLEAAFPLPIANVVFLGSAWAAGLAARRGRVDAALSTLLAYTAAALVDYMLMPTDWMGENRFGTTFLVLYPTLVFVLIDVALEIAPVRRKALVFAALTVSISCAGFPAAVGRAVAFARNSNISLFYVRSAFAERLDRYAAAFEVENPSVLLPDVGGMLLWSHARIYDLAGLCDATIARFGANDPEGEREYILAEARPTFIHTYAKYSQIALERDPRFLRDYLPIHSYDREEDGDSRGHASGLFVRREAVASSEAEARLESIRREPQARLALMPRLPPSPLLRWFESSLFRKTAAIGRTEIDGTDFVNQGGP